MATKYHKRMAPVRTSSHDVDKGLKGRKMNPHHSERDFTRKSGQHRLNQAPKVVMRGGIRF